MSQSCKYPYLKACLIVTILLLVYNSETVAQIGLGTTIKTSFLKDSLLVSDNSFYFNSLSLTNNSRQQLNLEISIDVPCFTNLVTANKQIIQAEAGQTLLLPIRFSGNNKTSCSLSWQFFTCNIKDLTTGLVTTESFKVKPILNSRWKLSLPEPYIFVQTDTKKVSFFVSLANIGNVTAQYKLSIQSAIPVDINSGLNLTLKAGEVRLQEIKVLLSPAGLEQLRSEEITVFVECEHEKKMVVQKLAKLGNSYKEHESRWQKVPLSVELNALNVSGNNATYYARINGNLWRQGDKELNVFAQTNNYSQGFTNATGLQLLQYKTKAVDVNAGTILDFNNFIIDGNGTAAKWAPNKKALYEATLVKGRLNNSYQSFFKARQALSTNVTYTGNNVYINDVDNNQTSIISQHGLEYNFNNGFQVGFEQGFGYEDLSTIKYQSKLRSSSTKAFVEKTQGKFLMNAKYSSNSANFPGLYRGFKQYMHDVRYNFKTVSIGSYAEVNYHTPNVLRDTVLLKYFNYNNVDIGGRLSYTGTNGSITVMPGLYTQVHDSINSFKAIMPKVNLQLMYNSNGWQVSSINNIGTISTANYSKKIFSMSNIITLQKDHLGLFGRVDVGPYYYSDIKRFIELDENVAVRFQVTPFHNMVLTKWNVAIRNQATYSYTGLASGNNLFLSNSIYWQVPEKGFGAGISSDVQINNKVVPRINLLLRKNFNVPLFPKKGYKKLKVLLYKDVNKNNRFDEEDERIPAARLTLNNREIVQTNNNGEVLLENVLSKNIHLDLTAVTNVRGWIPLAGYKQLIYSSESKTVFIGFKQGRTITGRIVIDKDSKSDKVMSIENIRITATAVDGTTFSTLTGAKGIFSLDVPEGEYTVLLNQNAIDEDYKAVDAVRNLDLKNNSTLNVDFLIKQRRREINIIKQ